MSDNLCVSMIDGELCITCFSAKYVRINSRQYNIQGEQLPIPDAKYIEALWEIDKLHTRDRGYSKATSRKIRNILNRVLAQEKK